MCEFLKRESVLILASLDLSYAPVFNCNSLFATELASIDIASLGDVFNGCV